MNGLIYIGIAVVLLIAYLIYEQSKNNEAQARAMEYQAQIGGVTSISMYNAKTVNGIGGGYLNFLGGLSHDLAPALNKLIGGI